jgi:hypothetical protein
VLAESAHCARRMGCRARDARVARLGPNCPPSEARRPLICIRRWEGVQKVYRDVGPEITEGFRIEVYPGTSRKAKPWRVRRAGRSRHGRGTERGMLLQSLRTKGRGIPLRSIFIRHRGVAILLRRARGRIMIRYRSAEGLVARAGAVRRAWSEGVIFMVEGAHEECAARLRLHHVLLDILIRAKNPKPERACWACSCARRGSLLRRRSICREGEGVRLLRGVAAVQARGGRKRACRRRLRGIQAW